MISLPPLPYAINALEPYISAKTLSFHYGKHHQAYVNKVNDGIKANSSLEGKSLTELVKTVPMGPLFNSAAQAWNHEFYWKSMSPGKGGVPSGKILDLIVTKWGSFEEFKKEFTAKSVAHFGSGWIWLVQDVSNGSLSIMDTHDAGTPILNPVMIPLLTCDVWEHAFYLDVQNRKPEYIAAWFNLVNWDFAASLLQ